MGNEILIIGGLAAAAVGAFVFKDQIAEAVGNFDLGGLGGGGGPVVAETGGGPTDVDVSGNGCACANGRCIGNCSGNVYAGELPSGMTPIEFVKSKVPGAFGGRAHAWAYAGRAGRYRLVGLNRRGGRVYR